MKNREFDKYALYRKAVQSPETDVEFLRDTYRELKKKTPRVLREDFCGTFAICCEWVRLHRDFEAFGVDLDPEPLSYGRTHYFSQLNFQQQQRVHILQQNVMGPNSPRADLICAMNFSHYIFKTRQDIRKYMGNCLKTLNDDGILVIDLFGGSRSQIANEEQKVHRTFSYYWDQKSYDPISNRAEFAIHFKPRGSKKILDVFTYDWRMWTIPELRDLLEEIGFRRTHVYWEGTSRSGEGNGEFTRSEKGEECEGWIAYLVSEK